MLAPNPQFHSYTHSQSHQPHARSSYLHSYSMSQPTHNQFMQTSAQIGRAGQGWTQGPAMSGAQTSVPLAVPSTQPQSFAPPITTTTSKTTSRAPATRPAPTSTPLHHPTPACSVPSPVTAPTPPAEKTSKAKSKKGKEKDGAKASQGPGRVSANYTPYAEKKIVDGVAKFKPYGPNGWNELAEWFNADPQVGDRRDTTSLRKKFQRVSDS